ncbi:uncharacterized protein N7483_002537 [Penicillium malachiteum]|uniref:uncharacterized protein n=1 Tax=Penicillium malachiteum TaxID=1324776 RepID=UPI00254799D2|nr:uncharacterized protein N7483_002537 [Penicillium malachiteum]KAJ5737412.1 hypothetical protein N7483_002537 [Penicillium malachiteum]
MPRLQDQLPPPYTERARDPLPETSPHTSIPKTREHDFLVSAPKATPDPETPIHTGRGRGKRLKKKLAKGLKLGAGAIVLTAAVPVVFVANVAYEGGKAVLQVVAAPVVVCVVCFCIDDFDF